jgi:Spy/CpxP family protein refolding chaperone
MKEKQYMKKIIVIAIIALVAIAIPLIILAQSPMHAGKAGKGAGMGAGMGTGMGAGMNCAPKAQYCGQMMRGRGMKGRGMGPRMGMGMGIGMILRNAEKLELTADQKTKLEKMQTDFQLLAIDQRAKIEKAAVQMRDLMRDDKAATTAVEAQIDQMAKVRAEMAKMQYRHMAEARAVLTDKQRETLKQSMGPRCGMRGDIDDNDEPGDMDMPDGPDGSEG